jgi:serine/threonine-protein phosphatase 4 regulatory subunit 2
VGKYLRAVEKVLLVTSTQDSFEPFSEKDKDTTILTLYSSIRSADREALSTPSTPLFSPIPFLHSDARRSQSRSPPPSPLVLGAIGPIDSTEGLEPLEPKTLGLVDELDDPGPGHMSEHPVALTATTTSESTAPVASLEERFVKASETGDEMEVEDENKENAAI